MKLKRLLTLAIVAVLALSTFAFVGCNEADKDSGNDGGKSETYVMEAEYVDLSDVVGTGISSDQQHENMIYGEGTEEQKKMWSNGYFVGYTYTSKCKITFKFNSDKAVNATFVLALGSEIGDITLNPENFKIELNAKEVNYSAIKVNNSTDISKMAFKDCTVATVALKEGENEFTLSVLPNKLLQGTKDGGPCIDCLKIKTTAKITFTEKKDNPSKRGSM